jgi:P5-type ATPase cation transporter
MNGQQSGPTNGACSPQCGSGGKVAGLPNPTATAKFPHPSVGEIDSGEEGGEHLAIYGYREHCAKRAVTAALCLLTLGTLPLLLYWLPRLRLKFTAVRCGLETCDCVLVTDRGRLNEIQRVRMQCATGVGGLGKLLLVLPMRGGREVEVESFRYFLFRKLKYYWNPEERRFVTAREMTEGVS